MSRQYYYLVAGLPDVFFDDKKLSYNTGEYRSYLSEHLGEKEIEFIKLHFWQYDNKNILNKLENNSVEINTLGNLNSEMLDELFAATKDNSLDSLSFGVPEYIIHFIHAFKSDKAIFQGKSWDLQITELYYQYIAGTNNKFIKEWFLFEQKLNNLLTAFNCRNNDLNIENQLIGSGDLNEKLIKSSARDFGVDNDDLPNADAFIKAIATKDLLEQEQKIDTLRWQLIDELSFFHYFSIEKLFVFIIKLSIIERWISLDKTKGLKLFKELLDSLETSYEFPADFSLK